ncbi:50S ribosomal protein L33 [Candidatus Woesebacteria bacterium]|nr:50S ribosomal protein L33 [Candidatus Woesebacteria bacterium]
MAVAGREIVGMVCTKCKSQNYITTRNKVNIQNKTGGSGKLEVKKYCKNCKKKTTHKETSKLK